MTFVFTFRVPNFKDKYVAIYWMCLQRLNQKN